MMAGGPKAVRILAPVEQGESSTGAGRVIAAIFPPSATEVTAFHVAELAVSSFYVPPGVEWFDSLRQGEVASLNRAVARLERQFAPLRRNGMGVSVQATAGSPLAEVLRRASLGQEDLIVAGCGRRRTSLGGVAVGLLQASPLPVLLHRGVPARYRVRRVVAATDFSPHSRHAASWALLLAGLTGARLLFLHVGPGDAHPWAVPMRDRLCRLLNGEVDNVRGEAGQFGIRPEAFTGTLRHADSPAEGIRETLQRTDLLVIGTSGQTGLASVIGSVTRRVARFSPSPILAVGPGVKGSAIEIWRRLAAALPK